MNGGKTKQNLKKYPMIRSKKKNFHCFKTRYFAKYIRDENYGFSPHSTKLDWMMTIEMMWFKVYVNGEQVFSEEIRTKRGELVVTTKQKNLN